MTGNRSIGDKPTKPQIINSMSPVTSFSFNRKVRVSHAALGKGMTGKDFMKNDMVSKYDRLGKFTPMEKVMIGLFVGMVALAIISRVVLFIVEHA